VTKRPILVVGAGPAGATAARTLAAAGVPVCLLDRSSFPRNKPCGGGISTRVLTRFPYLESALQRITTHTVARLHLEGPDGHSTIIESDGPAALLIRRIEYDALLVSLAVEAGATLVPGVDVVQAWQDAERVELVARDGRRLEGAIVVAADGVNSVIARRLGLNPGWPASSVAIDMMEETPRAALRDVDPSTLWVAYGYDARKAQGSSLKAQGSKLKSHGSGLEAQGSESSNLNLETSARRAPEGYAYIFPKRDHVNIGIGYVLSHYRQAIDAAPYELQQRFVSRLRERGVVVGDSVKQNFTPFLIPVGGPLRETGRGRVLLAGDAGGFVNGFTAEGIYYGMVSGELAARAILETGNGVTNLARRYRRACDYEIGPELRDSVRIQRYLFADRRRIARVISGANRERSSTRLILDFAMGRRSYRDLRRRFLLRMPWLAGQLVWEQLREKTVVERGRGH
jgi:flavin-dependent dehydrogenase